MNDFFNKRQVCIEGITDEDLMHYGNLIDKYFDKVWMETNKENPISKLYRRKDSLASQELITLGRALDIIENNDIHWLSGQLQKVKSKNINNIKGALFEIIGFSYVGKSKDYKLKLASDGNPGIDGHLIYNNGARTNISMKNYGVSNFEQKFQKEMKVVEEYLKDMLIKSNLLSINAIIEFKRYPDGKDYVDLREMLKEGFNKFSLYLKSEIHTDWVDIILQPLAGYMLSDKVKSYIIIALSPQHKNEFVNLLSKIDDACANIIKQKKKEDNGEINGICIHLSENADIKGCQKVAQNYLNDNPDKPISFIIVYSSSVGTSEIDGYNPRIVNVVQPAINIPRYSKWLEENKVTLPIIEFSMGMHSLKESRNYLIVNDIRKIDISDKYMFQRGEVYEIPKRGIDGSFISELKLIAPGVKNSFVLPIKKGKFTIVQGVFSEFDELEIM